MPVKQNTKMNVYEIVTDRILTALENGVVPWEKPWDDEIGAPMNLVSKKPMRGINIWLLSMAAAAARYSSPYWVSFKQAKDLGGSVKKNEKSTVIIFWKPVKKEESKTGNPYRILRYYRVFNVEQCEGFEHKIPVKEERPDFDPIAEAEGILQGYREAPKTLFGGSRAAYAPKTDSVYMPEKESFKSPADYYSTHFHEYLHSTGHKLRLNRKGIENFDGFGSHQYSEEELVAEFGAAFLCGVAGISDRTVDNSAAYIAGWKSKISSDPHLVINAARLAQKAADHILGISWEKPEETESEEENAE